MKSRKLKNTVPNNKMAPRKFQEKTMLNTKGKKNKVIIKKKKRHMKALGHSPRRETYVIKPCFQN